jgi:hypothetical protein
MQRPRPETFSPRILASGLERRIHAMLYAAMQQATDYDKSRFGCQLPANRLRANDNPAGRRAIYVI